MSSRATIIVVGTLLLAVSACAPASRDRASTSSLGNDDPTTTEMSTTSPARSATSSTAPSSTTVPQQVGTEPTSVCTEIGCNSGLTIELSEFDIEPNGTYHVEICVDGDCTAETITVDLVNAATGQISHGESQRAPGTLERHILMWPEDDYVLYYLPEQNYGETVAVTLTLEDVNGRALPKTVDTTDVPIERSQPNGPGCPPICFLGRLTV